MKIGIWELILIGVVALFVIGPDQLPKYARMLGESLAQFRKSTAGLQKELHETLEPIREATNIFKESTNMSELKDDLNKSINEAVTEPLSTSEVEINQAIVETKEMIKDIDDGSSSQEN